MQLFVYGTLTDPTRVEALLEETDATAAFEGSATLEGLERVEGRYPTLVPAPDADPESSVEGQILTVDEAALERFDRYEGVDQGLYVRVAVPTTDERKLWTYVGDPDRLGVDASDWATDDHFRDAIRRYVARHVTVGGIHE
ncbi:gamma-glutamylcyclotransferase family protein [Natronolimnohabitans innermongolicus]|uniref:AIG2 family protein n=1 Tax=Natronolimnohabitans innermongolicus JCM 12255 TaxID=1227499 RepID=L9WU44_9EURY|nr:gamma-glutamylcyclotransferase family protein [Natronolimnohabitans innermongolicus]ELY52937.1 AIG2 family protein [Natronolimnohabitans innermongolicus JCM 12255]